jgi:hypothetical protein
LSASALRSFAALTFREVQCAKTPWVKEQEDRRERRARIIMVATIAAAAGAWIAALMLLSRFF